MLNEFMKNPTRYIFYYVLHPNKFQYEVRTGIKEFKKKKKIIRQFPFLRKSNEKLKNRKNEINLAYERYIKEISTPIMAISRETAVFLLTFCEGIKAKRILDLGSGFSSFIFRSYAANQSDVIIWSVDDNEEWLIRTKYFLALHNLSTENLMLWEQFRQKSNYSFDFISYDLGDMSSRAGSLSFILDLGEKSSALIMLDDMHKSPYEKYVFNTLKQYSYSYLDLSPYTLDEFRRYCGLLYIFARKPQAFKPGDEWHPERSGGHSSSWQETPAFRPGSFHSVQKK